MSEEEYGDDWVCHDCGDGGKTPWNPEEGCPNYPCHAHKRSECELREPTSFQRLVAWGRSMIGGDTSGMDD